MGPSRDGGAGLPAELLAELNDIDLRDMPWMPLDVIRLRDSDFALKATGDEFQAAVLLWCAAWHQVPAASLPDDDALLGRLAGYGRDLEGWMRVRPFALHGFECGGDGRLYHPVIAEKAIEARDRLRQRESSRAKTRRRVAAYRQRQKSSEAIERDPGPGEGEAGGPGNGAVTVTGARYETDGNAATEQHRDNSGLPPVVPRAPEPAGRTRGSALPAEWVPDSAGVKFAVECGLDHELMLARFRDHVAGLSGARARSPDWDARWREWCRTAAERNAGRRRPDAGRDPAGYFGTNRESQWDVRVKGWRPGGFWPSDWGAPPGDARCEAPPHILRKYGHPVPVRH